MQKVLALIRNLFGNDISDERGAENMDYTHTENETMFLSWLSSNVSPALLSELYLAFSEIEHQAKKSRLIRRSLYEDLTVSAVKKISTDIERSKIFKFTHKRQWSHILSALDYLQKFAAQNQVEDFVERVNSLIAGQDEAVDGYMNSKELKATQSVQKETEEVSSVHADEDFLSEEVSSVYADEDLLSEEVSSVHADEDLLSKEVSSAQADEDFLSEEVKTSAMDRTVHFDSLESMAFTMPISLSYLLSCPRGAGK